MACSHEMLSKDVMISSHVLTKPDAHGRITKAGSWTCLNGAVWRKQNECIASSLEQKHNASFAQSHFVGQSRFENILADSFILPAWPKNAVSTNLQDSHKVLDHLTIHGISCTTHHPSWVIWDDRAKSHSFWDMIDQTTTTMLYIATPYPCPV